MKWVVIEKSYIEMRFDESEEEWERQSWIDLMEFQEAKMKEEQGHDR